MTPARAAAAALAPGSENCLPVGTRLADFEITGVLGEGGFGIVYLAFDHTLHRTVAVKEYMPSALAMRGADGAVSLRAERHQDTFRTGLKSFINEARMLAQFDHPALVKVHRFWEQNRTAYTAMQYYEGRTVKDIVARSPGQIDEAWCRKLLTQILQALEMLYTMQIVHRDVSPDNIIVQPNGDAVLLDFGSARQIIGDMTQGLTVILKPGYAPVEQYANDATLAQGPYTDIYALSAVIYFAVTGTAPTSSIARIIQDPLVPLGTLAPDGYGIGFLAAIEKGLAVRAEDRPQTIAAFRALLGIDAQSAPPVRLAGATERLAPAVTIMPATPDTPMPVVGAETAAPAPAAVPPAPARRRAPLLAAGAAVVLIGAALLYAQLRSADDTVMPAHPQPRVAAAPVPQAAPVDAVSSLGPSETLVTDVPAPDAAPPKAEPKPAPAADTVAVALTVKPWGNVYVDGRDRGVSPPMKRLALAPGAHKIRIVNPNYPAYATTIILKKNQAGAIAHDFGAAAN